MSITLWKNRYSIESPIIWFFGIKIDTARPYLHIYCDNKGEVCISKNRAVTWCDIDKYKMAFNSRRWALSVIKSKYPKYKIEEINNI